MLIRVGGGLKGIAQYLKTGRKKGRVQGRDELDERIVLIGDLDVMDEAIHTLARGGEKYLHITLSFREDEVPTETLRSVAESFQTFIRASFRPDELMCYAEAHLPRLKSLDSSSGTAIDRFVHIHFVVPKLNLLTGKVADPLGRVARQIPYLDAYQEWANALYGFVSPKDSRRVHFEDGSDILARHKADVFAGANKAVKQTILEAILEQGISSEVDLATYLATIGVVRRRNDGRPDAYFNVKLAGDPKGVNLKEMMFSRSFLQLSEDEKKAKLLQGLTSEKFMVPGPRRDAGIERPKLLREWFSIRSREVKYLNSGNRSQWAAYQRLEETDRVKFLDGLEAKFYANIDSAGSPTQELVPAIAGFGGTLEPVSMPTLIGMSDSSLGHRIRLAVEASLDTVYLERVSTQQGGFPLEQIRGDLVVRYGLPTKKFQALLAKAHGQGPKGLYLFLRRHMNQPPNRAWVYLVRHGLAQPSQLAAPKRTVSDRLWQEYLHRKKKLVEIAEVADRRAALAVLQMSLVLSRKYLWAQNQEASTRTNAMEERDPVPKAFSGPDEPAKPCEPEQVFQPSEWSHRSDTNGHVEFLRREKPVIRDEIQRVVLEETDAQVIEVALRLAILKFGPKIRVTGPEEFKRKTVLVASRMNFEIGFLDPELQKELEKLRREATRPTGEFSL